jgi:hypothetical protein
MLRETDRYRNRTNFDNVLADLSKLKGGVFITIGYVTGNAVSKTLQNKDTEAFGNDIDQYQEKGTPGYDMLKQWQQGGASRKNASPVGIMKYTETTYHWQTPGSMGKKYGAYKDGVNKLLKPYGAEIGTRQKQNDSQVKPGDTNNVTPPNDETKVDNHIYQNAATSSKVSEEYFMVKDGKIYGSLNKGALRSLMSKEYIDGVSALKKLGVQKEEIENFVEQVKNLKYKQLPLVPDKILWISYTIEDKESGEKISKFAINDNFTDNIDGIQINPNIFVKRANARYEKRFRAMPGYEDKNEPVVHKRQAEYPTTESKNRQLRLTESELKQVVKDATMKIIKNIYENKNKRVTVSEASRGNKRTRPVYESRRARNLRKQL